MTLGSLSAQQCEVPTIPLSRRPPLTSRWRAGSLMPRAPASGEADVKRLWQPCKRCLPLPGDPLVGTASGGIGEVGTVHRREGECLELRRQLAAGENLISAEVPEQADALHAAIASPPSPTASPRDVFITKLIIFTRDRPGILLDVSSVVTAETLNIIDVRSETRQVKLRCVPCARTLWEGRACDGSR